MGARGSDDREWWCGWGCPAAPQHLHPLPGPAALGGNPAITNMVAPVQTALAPCFLGVTVAMKENTKLCNGLRGNLFCFVFWR